MLKISHRGNTKGTEKDRENSPDFIQNAINCGFDVEIDVWDYRHLYLGHDSPQVSVEPQWLLDRKDKLWVHAKNFHALIRLADMGMRVFFHEKDRHTFIANSDVIWSHDLREANERSIIPILGHEAVLAAPFVSVYGICSDFVELL